MGNLFEPFIFHHTTFLTYNVQGSTYLSIEEHQATPTTQEIVNPKYSEKELKAIEDANLLTLIMVSLYMFNFHQNSITQCLFCYLN
jgi:hypothetical protein